MVNGDYPADSDKCNLFVYQVTTQAGATPGLPHGHWFWKRYPPNAVDWTHPSVEIPQWRLLWIGERPEPGDVIAQSLNYVDATGHVMIVGFNDTVIGTGDSGKGPPGTIEMIPRPQNLGPKPRGPERYRRWSSEP